MTIDLATIKSYFSAIDSEVLGSAVLYVLVAAALFIAWRSIRGLDGFFRAVGADLKIIISKLASTMSQWSTTDLQNSRTNYTNINEMKDTVTRTETKVDKILDKVDKFKEVN